MAIKNVIVFADLTVLVISEYDVILGMNQLSRHNIIVDCNKGELKTVKLDEDEVLLVTQPNMIDEELLQAVNVKEIKEKEYEIVWLCTVDMDKKPLALKKS